jgi:hypothetical protein
VSKPTRRKTHQTLVSPAARGAMPVTMSGSPVSYPGPSGEVWAKRQAMEHAKAKQLKAGYSELNRQKMEKKELEEKARKEKKAEDERKFKAAQEARAKKQAQDRTYRAKVREKSLEQINSEHQKYLREERIREQSRIQLAKMRIQEQGQGVLNEDLIEQVLDAGDVEFSTKIAEEAMQQRRVQEELDAEHEAELKYQRDLKAKQKEMEEKQKHDEERRQQREQASRIKKEMAQQTKRERERAEKKEKEAKARRDQERKKNDEYQAWLAKGDLMRDEQELMNERREGSAMHKGSRFSGIPDTKVDGKGNQ